ncbi:GNAT family N-acetyltransferase [Amycolatopsis echigonensis]|uniref:Acetyltransferase (GNAT) family protein n=1 Tax=Amycolatopsis echigonensis TaxID=2576905 RepID=A0A2N3X0A5_9PSEU|nr:MULTISPECIES: GNAT family N-acetyltransferase [Amycolatopsis]MBB2501242.1 GNAT family N-acetyltransferase [Amycolatopsis echigonensis]PKV99539.1 acetyltransferase (GNAT) family protein [Amycolatopsis niigatensis]
MPDEVGLRPTTPADSDFCFQVHRAALGEYVAAIWGWNDKIQRGYHDRAFTPGRWQVITVDGADAGLLVVEHRPAEVFLGRIELDPRYQGRGIGGRLLRRLIRVAAEREQPLVLEVLAVNTRAHAFYLRHGFRETGRTERKILLARSPGQED